MDSCTGNFSPVLQILHLNIGYEIKVCLHSLFPPIPYALLSSIVSIPFFPTSLGFSFWGSLSTLTFSFFRRVILLDVQTVSWSLDLLISWSPMTFNTWCTPTLWSSNTPEVGEILICNTRDPFTWTLPPVLSNSPPRLSDFTVVNHFFIISWGNPKSRKKKSFSTGGDPSHGK